jgi:hypothetical protein
LYIWLKFGILFPKDNTLSIVYKMILVIVLLSSMVAIGIVTYLLDYFCCKPKEDCGTRANSKKYQVYNGPLPSYGQWF